MSVIQGADPGKSRLIQPNPTKTVVSWFDKAPFLTAKGLRGLEDGEYWMLRLLCSPWDFLVLFPGIVGLELDVKSVGVARPLRGVGLLSSIVIPPE